MSFHPSYGYQDTEPTWHRISKPNFLLKKDITSEHNYWETSSKVLGKNPFSLMLNLFGHLSDQVEKNDIIIGKLAAKNKNVKLNLYYTPVSLTENSLIFSKRLMTKWWTQGYTYAKERHEGNIGV